MKSTPHTLEVPGTTLYYETQGSGPPLLMVPGGPTDAGVFAGLLDRLSDRFTAVAYDPRGNSRSKLAAPPADQQLDVHGDDAARLIDVLGGGPAFVLGSSGGAMIGLNLAARHPERVRALVAHEPPCVRLLPDAPAVLAANEEIDRAYRRDGAGAAMQKFMEITGFDGPPPPSDQPPEALETFARIGGNLDYFFAHGFKPLSLYLPDVEKLRSSPVRVVIGVGESSRGQLAYRAAVALAQKLGIEPVHFPGDHGGYGSQPEAFAEVLAKVLDAGREQSRGLRKARSAR